MQEDITIYFNTVKLIAKKFSNLTHLDPVCYSFEDLVSEGLLAIAEVLYEEKKKPQSTQRSTRIVRRTHQRLINIYIKRNLPKHSAKIISTECSFLHPPDYKSQKALSLAELPSPAREVAQILINPPEDFRSLVVEKGLKQGVSIFLRLKLHQKPSQIKAFWQSYHVV